MSDPDQTLGLLMELGVLGPEDAEAIRQLLADDSTAADGAGERVELSGCGSVVPVAAKAVPMLGDTGADYRGGDGRPATPVLLLIAALGLLREATRNWEPAKGESARPAEASAGGDQANAKMIAPPGETPGNGGKREAGMLAQFLRAVRETIAESGAPGEELQGVPSAKKSTPAATPERGAVFGPETASGVRSERPAQTTAEPEEGRRRAEQGPESAPGDGRVFPEQSASAPVTNPAAGHGDHAAAAAIAQKALEACAQGALAMAELAHRVEVLESATANLRNIQGGQG
jgi:hypothetical protein